MSAITIDAHDFHTDHRRRLFAERVLTTVGIDKGWVRALTFKDNEAAVIVERYIHPFVRLYHNGCPQGLVAIHTRHSLLSHASHNP